MGWHEPMLDEERLVAEGTSFAEITEMVSRVTLLEEEVSAQAKMGAMVSASPKMLRVFEVMRHVVDSKVSVLIEGESGTGKELTARALHDEGPRASDPCCRTIEGWSHVRPSRAPERTQAEPEPP